MILRTAEFLRGAAACSLMRAGAFKPRTQSVRVSGHGAGRAGDSRPGAREDRHRHRHRIDGHRQRRRRRGRRPTSSRSARATCRTSACSSACRKASQAGAAQARHVGDAGRMADGRRVRHGRRQLQRGPVRARRAHLLRPQPQHARPVGDPAGQEAVAPADPGRSQPRHRQARLRAADGAGGAGGRRGRPADRGASRPGPRRCPTGRSRWTSRRSRSCWSRCAGWRSRWARR